MHRIEEKQLESTFEAQEYILTSCRAMAMGQEVTAVNSVSNASLGTKVQLYTVRYQGSL